MTVTQTRGRSRALSSAVLVNLVTRTSNVTGGWAMAAKDSFVGAPSSASTDGAIGTVCRSGSGASIGGGR